MPACGGSAASSACRRCPSCWCSCATAPSRRTDVAALLERCTFPPPGIAVVAGVSGGADSTALLGLAVEAGCHVTAVHVDHGLRGGSEAEADVVRDLARDLGAGF